MATCVFSHWETRELLRRTVKVKYHTKKKRLVKQFSEIWQQVLHPVLKEQDVWLVLKNRGSIFSPTRISDPILSVQLRLIGEPSATLLLKHHCPGLPSGSLHSMCI